MLLYVRILVICINYSLKMLTRGDVFLRMPFFLLTAPIQMFVSGVCFWARNTWMVMRSLRCLWVLWTLHWAKWQAPTLLCCSWLNQPAMEIISSLCVWTLAVTDPFSLVAHAGWQAGGRGVRTEVRFYQVCVLTFAFSGSLIVALSCTRLRLMIHKNCIHVSKWDFSRCC